MASPIPSDRIAFLSGRLYAALQAEVYDGLPARGFGDIRPAHSAVLRNLPEEGARPGVLAERALMTKQSMAALIEDLARLGYVSVRPHPADGRARLVVPTPAGLDAQGALAALSRRAEARLEDRLGAAGLESLRGLLGDAVAAMSEAGETNAHAALMRRG